MLSAIWRNHTKHSTKDTVNTQNVLLIGVKQPFNFSSTALWLIISTWEKETMFFEASYPRIDGRSYLNGGTAHTTSIKATKTSCSKWKPFYQVRWRNFTTDGFSFQNKEVEILKEVNHFVYHENEILSVKCSKVLDEMAEWSGYYSSGKGSMKRKATRSPSHHSMRTVVSCSRII